ncbi:MAG: hypothetical protein LOD91_03640 [Limnochordales bacterium]|nr:hypothetical protein [Limnochordales bacterium]
MPERNPPNQRQQRFQQPQRQRRQDQDTEFAAEPGVFQPQQQARQKQPREPKNRESEPQQQ